MTNAVLIFGGVALSAVLVGRPVTPDEGGELAAGALALLLIDSIALQFIFKRQRRDRLHVGSAVELTAREIEIVRLIADGYTAKEIAETLFISAKTVDAHRSHILRKLGVRDRVGLVRYAIKSGLVKL